MGSDIVCGYGDYLNPIWGGVFFFSYGAGGGWNPPPLPKLTLGCLNTISFYTVIYTYIEARNPNFQVQNFKIEVVAVIQRWSPLASGSACAWMLCQYLGSCKKSTKAPRGLILLLNYQYWALITGDMQFWFYIPPQNIFFGFKAKKILIFRNWESQNLPVQGSPKINQGTWKSPSGLKMTVMDIHEK